MSHACPRNGCTSVIPDDKLMCAKDWALVPQYLQRDVTRYWRASRSAIALADRKASIHNYRVAREAAIEHVNKLLAPLAN